MSSSSSWGISTGPIEVPQYFQDGEKFVKWDEDSNAGLLVTLRVDPKGFFLYWTDQNMEVDMLDITNIRDVRTGQYAKVPKEGKLRALVSIGASACSGSLEEKTVSVCWGTDFVNVAFANFCCATKDMAQKWTTWLFELAYNINQLNPSPLRLLEKIHMKIQLKLDRDKMLPVNNIVRAFASAKEERRRVLAAMAEAGLPSDKGARLPADTFTFDRFMRLYRALTARDELVEVFLEASEGEQTLTPNRLAHFLNTQQRDPRLNEVLHPYADEARALELVRVHETDAHRKEQGVMTFDGFLRFLLSDDSPPIAPNRLQLSDDMERPMAHYFINSSHNTYLTGHQITGKSSVEMYRQSLLAGCRCVELDLWNGRTDEPIIVHGYTFVPEVLAKDVLEAIAESAFKTSEYPVVLSFENHCNARQQAKVAQYCREIFGDMLLDRPMESHPLRPGGELPSPHSLRRKIIIKNKKKHHHHHHHHRKDIEPILVEPPAEPPADNNGLADHNEKDEGKESSTSESESSSGEEEACADSQAGAETQAETHAGEEISALVNYVQPVHFTSFENAEKKSRFYEMSSFDEKQAATLLKERPVEFVNYNKWQLSRVYPAGTRFDSSNFMPQVFWNAGCQLVALNYQTMDAPMQLNLGAFECNRRCGYLLKPEFMRRADRRLDPFAERTVDGVVAGSLAVRVVSAQLASERRCSTSVEVDLLGLPVDTVRKRYRTKAAPHNGLNPRYQPETFHFRKVVMPELAWLRLALLDEGGRLLGQRVLPLASLRQGWRHVPLRGEGGRALAATLLLHVAVADYVPDRLAELADALSNPIKYQSELDRRDHQLRALMDDAPAEEDAAPAPTVATPAPVAVVSSEPDPAPSGPVAADTPEEERLGSSCEELHLVLQCRAAELKRTELNRKLEALKRKPTRLQARLVKRLSVLNVSGGSSEVSEADAERELRLRYHHAVFLALDNHAKNIHQQQMKALTDLLETEKKEILNRLANARKEDVKAMLKKTNRDKDEIVRIKREIHSQSVERGVAECSRLEAQYERKREQVARRHERVARRLQKLKAEQLARLNEEYADLT